MNMLTYARNRLLSALQKRTLHFARVPDVKQHCLYQRLTNSTYNARAIHNDYLTTPIMAQDEQREQLTVWPDISDYITDAAREIKSSEVTQWLDKLLHYTVIGGKNVRSLTLIRAYKILTPAEQFTQENLQLARVLAWCVELLQTFLLVLDDVEDQSYIRRKRPCWFRCKGVGFAAINDGVILENSIYRVLRKYFKDHEKYIDIVEDFRETTLTTVLGQCLEFVNYGNTMNLDNFTMDHYNDIAYYKSSYYTFILPVTVVMRFIKIDDQELFREIQEIMREIGHFFQVQDDYLSCYENFETNKTGTDIQEGKCTWLVTTALQRVTPKQRKVLEECYGSSDPEKVRRVKLLYHELDLLNAYRVYEKETYNQMSQRIQQMSCERLKLLSQQTLDELYGRPK